MFFVTECPWGAALPTLALSFARSRATVDLLSLGLTGMVVAWIATLVPGGVAMAASVPHGAWKRSDAKRIQRLWLKTAILPGLIGFASAAVCFREWMETYRVVNLSQGGQALVASSVAGLLVCEMVSPALLMVLLVKRSWVARQAVYRDPSMCPHCQYGLHGLEAPTHCPECGQPVDEQSRQAALDRLLNG